MRDSQSQPIRTPLKTQIVAVTVYPDQARVTRRGQIDVSPSFLLLEVTHLPSGIQMDDGLQAHPSGTARVTLQRPLLEPLKDDGTCLSLERSLQALEDEFRQCKDELAQLNTQKSFLESLSARTAHTFARGLSEQRLDLTVVSRFLEFFEQTHQKISRAIATHERLKHTLDVKLQDSRQAVLQLQGKATPLAYQILLPVQIHTPGTLYLEIIYGVDGAKWKPVYDVRVDKDPTRLTIDCLAEIQQQTGEAWDDVAIRVSTAVPEKTPAIPTAPLWRDSTPATEVEIVPSRSARRKVGSNVLEDAYRMLGAVPGSEVPPSDHNEEDWSASVMKLVGTTISFVAPQRAAIAADGKPHPVLVNQFQADCEYTYIAIPQQCSAPYLQARVNNPSEGFPLLPGKAYLFRAGGYVGEEDFEYAPPGSSSELSLGLDDRITIQRELVSKAADYTDPCRNLRAFRLNIHNPFPYPITMDVLEQMPASQSEDIRITLQKAEPTPALGQAGVCQWELEIPAEGTRQIFYEYTVEHPCDVPVLGMEG
jgi:uncharacterized protein (TIGR02231 family)